MAKLQMDNSSVVIFVNLMYNKTIDLYKTVVLLSVI
jgi:hypothetical protein